MSKRSAALAELQELQLRRDELMYILDNEEEYLTEGDTSEGDEDTGLNLDDTQNQQGKFNGCENEQAISRYLVFDFRIGAKAQHGACLSVRPSPRVPRQRRKMTISSRVAISLKPSSNKRGLSSFF